MCSSDHVNLVDFIKTIFLVRNPSILLNDVTSMLLETRDTRNLSNLKSNEFATTIRSCKCYSSIIAVNLCLTEILN